MITLEGPTPSSAAVPTAPEKYSVSSSAREEAALDAKLVGRFQAGDESAFEEIAHKYRQKLFVVAYRLLRNRDDAEEMAQDALLRAHRGLNSFRGESSLSTWLGRVVSNLSKNRYWQLQSRGAGRTLSLDIKEDGRGAPVDFLSNQDLSASREISMAELNELVKKCLVLLEHKERRLLELRAVCEMSYEQIASSLQLSQGTVKSSIRRARRLLVQKLLQECQDFGEQAAPMMWLELGR